VSKIKDSLAGQTRQFADDLQILLGQTVCDFAKVDGRILSGGNQAIVGTNLQDLGSRPIRIRSSADVPLWIDVVAYLMLDEDESRFLTVRSSVCGLSVGDPAESVLHYDFERNKARYTEAHLQVNGRHQALERMLSQLGRKEVDALAKIHLPVGGRRFRPALEDVLECLVDEGLAIPKTGWREVLDTSRRDYRRKQISAVVRRNPGTAIRELERLGYVVAHPDDSRSKAMILKLIGRPPKQRAAMDDDVPQRRTAR
jgi:hypothetical protein